MTIVYWIVLVGAVLGLGAIVVRFVMAWNQLSGTRVLVCPETRSPVGTTMKKPWTALEIAIGLKPVMELDDCTRWPDRARCDQSCLLQLEGAPGDCKLRTMLATWYEGKSCAYCREPFGEINWSDHKPALLSPEGITVDWNDVDPEQIHRILGSHTQVCWDCHIAESFRREHPELIKFVDQQRAEEHFVRRAFGRIGGQIVSHSEGPAGQSDHAPCGAGSPVPLTSRGSVRWARNRSSAVGRQRGASCGARSPI